MAILRTRTAVAAAVAIALLAPLASAQSLVVEYLEGLVEVGDAGGWREIGFGEEVAPRSSIRVAEDSYVQLQTASRTVVTISAAGVTQLEALLPQVGRVSSWNLSTVVGTKFRGLPTAAADRRAAVMGVRGSLATEDGTMWMQDRPAVIDDVVALIDEERFGEAIELGQAELDYLLEDEQTELIYHLGYATALLGNRAGALALVASLLPASDADYVLLAGTLFVESLRFKDALGVLQPYLDAFPFEDASQTVHILAGVSQRGIGDEAAASSSFQTAIDFAPGSDGAKLAQTLLAAR